MTAAITRTSLHCTYFEREVCRSCTLLSEKHDPVLVKSALVQEKLSSLSSPSSHGAVISPLWVPSSLFPSRSKVKLSVTGTREEPCIGLVDDLFQGKELLGCPLHVPILNALLERLRIFIITANIAPYDIAQRTGEIKGVILVANHDATSILVRLVLRSRESEARIRKHLPSFLENNHHVRVVSCNIQPLPAAILEGPEEIVLTSEDAIAVEYPTGTLYVGPQSFIQVSHEVAGALYAKVREILASSPATVLWDLYCGVGGFSYAAAPYLKEGIGVELSPRAIACAERARERNMPASLSFRAETVESFLAKGDSTPDVVLVNPPRRGLKREIVERLIALSPDRILYSSCSVDSLLEDIALFASHYRAQEVYPFDMFPLTTHFETLVVLHKRCSNVSP